MKYLITILTAIAVLTMLYAFAQTPDLPDSRGHRTLLVFLSEAIQGTASVLRHYGSPVFVTETSIPVSR